MSSEIRVIDAYQRLMDALACFTTHVTDELPISAVAISKEGEFVSDTAFFCDALKNMAVDFNIAAQETLAFPGALGGSEKTLELTQEINQLKQDFYQSMRDMLDAYESHDTAIVRDTLKPRFGALKLKHVYRKIKVIDYCPRRISWSKAANSMNVIVTQSKAFELLDALGDADNIMIQKRRLSTISPHEKLVLSRQMKPYSAVNVSTSKDASGLSTTVKMHTSLPVIYLYDEKFPRPMVIHAKARKRRSQACRNDKKIEDTPFLPAISAYRYK